MGSITFGGLATGMDTNSLISQLMELERQPIKRLESDKKFFNSRLDAFKTFNEKLKGLLTAFQNLDTGNEVRSYSAKAGSDSFFSTTASASAAPGSYQIEVKKLAQQQKDVSISGFSSKTANIFHNGTISINGTAISLGADESLTSIQEKINAESETTGVSATIINDGSTNGNRLVLTGKDAATTFTATLSGVSSDEAALDFGHTGVINATSGWYASDTAGNFSGSTFTINGTDIVIGNNKSLNDIRDAINAEEPTTGVSASVVYDPANGYRLELDRTTADAVTASVTGGTTKNGYAPLVLTDTAPTNPHTMSAQLATVVIDGITITSKNNTITDAIPGVTFDLLKTNASGETTNLAVSIDKDGTKKKIEEFVTKYNEIFSFISSQSDADWRSDQGFLSAKRRLQNLVVTNVGTSGAYNYLTELGITTDQKTGHLKIDSTKLENAIDTNLDSVVKLFAGETGVDGIAKKFTDYLDGITNSSTGFFASRQESTNSNVRRIDIKIDQIEARLEQREKTLRAQFEALEQLASTMNTQSAYLGQQLASIANLGGNK